MYRTYLSVLMLATVATVAPAQDEAKLAGSVKHVLLISVDGMHALDFANCAKGIPSINGGMPYCPSLAHLSTTGVVYTQALTPKVSDSFPGLLALVTGGGPGSTGVYYDVSYDRALSAPAVTTPGGIVGGADLCPGSVGTQVGFDETVDNDLTRLDGGGGINPQYLPRDPAKGCAPVYPHSFLRVNTVFEVVRKSGGYTAWSDKHPAYDLVNGPSGQGVFDLFSPEINSIPVALPSVPGCNPLPDPGNATSSNAWTDSFTNVICYDSLKVGAILNEINGKNHSGAATAPVPTLFGMNFQAVSVGEKLHDKTNGLTGGYMDSTGTPSPSLLNAIQFIDSSVGKMAMALKTAGLTDSTVIIITAKHGQSAIDPNRITRIPADVAGQSPSDLLGGVGTGLPGGGLVGQGLEDDASLLWLTDSTQVASSVTTLEKNEASFGGGEIFSGASLNQFLGISQSDSRVPDIIVEPNVGVVYTGKTKKISEHGGASNDDRNVLLVVSNPGITGSVFRQQVETRQVAPTILRLLGLDPKGLQAVVKESTPVLPQLPY